MELITACFWKGRRVLVTGHTGFKGGWLCHLLRRVGARVTGYALAPPTAQCLFTLSEVAGDVDDITGDIRDFPALRAAFERCAPEVVIHMAAQPLVRESYSNPLYTYETNAMGTANVCECVRLSDTVRSFLNVTTDKVYENHEWDWGYRETDGLDGYDPYSNSKSCSELITACYSRSFLADASIAASTARAGNVIGGGDFSADRILPDCVRAAKNSEPITVRNPRSTRPYQHVLDPLYAYMAIAEAQWHDSSLRGCYNVGPDQSDSLQTGQLADMFCELWGGASWRQAGAEGPHEASNLYLDCSSIKRALGWKPVWDITAAMARTVQWYKEWAGGGDVKRLMTEQIDQFLREAERI